VIVLDMWLDPRKCTEKAEDKAATQQLLETVRKVSEAIPVVMARGTDSQEDFLETRPVVFIRTKQAGFKDPQVVLEPAISVEEVAPRVSVALATLDADDRKVPLIWRAYSSPKAVGKETPRWMETLSVTAARSYANGGMWEQINAMEAKCKLSENSCEYPLTTLLKEEQLSILSAVELVCSGEQAVPNWKQCQSQIDSRQRKELADKIVVIGMTGLFAEDLHDSSIGKIPGVILQANYIESILDSRTFRPLPAWFQALIGIVWFMLIAWPSWRWTSHPWLALLYSTLFAFVPALLFELVILLWRWYPSLLFPVVIPVTLLVIGLETGKAIESMTQEGRAII
jgi:CHASE2 domain-containing sensor protein